MQDSWKIKLPGNIHISASTKGYITKSKFHEYGHKFIKYLKDNDLANQKNLLIVDGHKSHLYNLPFYEAMISNNIEVLTIPPHTSHLLQALDSVPFAQFKKYWEHNLCKYNNTHSGMPFEQGIFLGCVRSIMESGNGTQKYHSRFSAYWHLPF